MEQESDKTILGKLETLKHIHKVRANLYKCIEELDSRARLHDLTKLESPEKEVFGEYTPELSKVVYNSPEYKALLEKVKPAIEHHYSKNSHHPEYYKNGINDMSLFDILEMLVDWKSSTERVLNGNIRTSIDKNKERYGISDQLTQILHNTINRYF
jgi:hypothetical protein